MRISRQWYRRSNSKRPIVRLHLEFELCRLRTKVKVDQSHVAVLCVSYVLYSCCVCVRCEWRLYVSYYVISGFMFLWVEYRLKVRAGSVRVIVENWYIVQLGPSKLWTSYNHDVGWLWRLPRHPSTECWGFDSHTRQLSQSYMIGTSIVIQTSFLSEIYFSNSIVYCTYIARSQKPISLSPSKHKNNLKLFHQRC